MKARAFRGGAWAAVLLAVGCGDTAGGGRCDADAAPSLELGTGVRAFAAVADGQDLVLARGPQGGCHLWLAFLVTGLDPDRVTVDFAVSDRRAVRAAGRSQVSLFDVEDACGIVGFAAVIDEPWRLEDRAVTIAVALTDRRGVEVEANKSVVIRWPVAPIGVDRATLCGPRS